MATAEQQLYDKLKRIEPMKAVSTALFVKMSALNPANRTKNHVRMTLNALNEMIIKSQSGLFVLSNNDIVVVGQNIPPAILNEAMASVRNIFQSDSFAAANPTDFVKAYSLAYDFDFVAGYAKKAIADQESRQNSKQEIPLAPEHLDAILRNIQGFNILKVIRRQEAVGFTKTGGFSSLFTEYFTSMADLKKAIAPDVDVLSNRWLFQHLSETLDKRMLGCGDDLIAHTPGNISLNLNISTVFTPAFEAFLTTLSDGKSAVVEVGLADILQNTRNYNYARDLLRESGHKLLIDGLTPLSFDFTDLTVLNPDLLKLNWIPSLITADLGEKLRPFDPDTLILMRCEDENAMRWGLEHRIMRYQGYFIDKLTATITRHGCRDKANCTTAQCSARKACVAGSARALCTNQSRLDLPIVGKKEAAP